MILNAAKKFAARADVKGLSQTMMQLLDLKALSREIAITLSDIAMKQKDVIIAALSGEVGRFLRHVNLAEEAKKALSGLTVRIEVSFDAKPSAKTPAAPKRVSKSAKSRSRR